jgi:hypothetical protein
VLASAVLFITMVNSLVAGAWVGIVCSPLGIVTSVAFGVLAGIAYVGVFVTAGRRLYGQTDADPDSVRFPSPPRR